MGNEETQLYPPTLKVSFKLKQNVTQHNLKAMNQWKIFLYQKKNLYILKTHM